MLALQRALITYHVLWYHGTIIYKENHTVLLLLELAPPPTPQPLEASKGKVSTCHSKEILRKKGTEISGYRLC